MKKNLLFISALSILILVFTVPGAFAAAQLHLSSGGATVTIVDDGPGDQYTGLGTITFGGPIGGFIVNVTTGITKPIIGSTTFPEMDLVSVNVSGGAGSIAMWFTDIDFFGPTKNFKGAYGLTSIGGTYTYDAYLGPNNLPFETPLPALFSVSGGSGATSGYAFGPAYNVAAAYSLTQIVTFTHTAAGQISSGDFYLSAVPEPSALLLLGSGLVALGVVRKKFKK